MKISSLLLTACILLGAIEAHAVDDICAIGFDAGKTVSVEIYDATAAAIILADTTTGVTEHASTYSSSYCYEGAIAPTACHKLIMSWHDNSTPVRSSVETKVWDCASDPWATALPGAYTAGTAGYILGNYSQGGGDTAVNHNTGSADNLRYTTALGAGISGATIKAYLKTDYDAGSRTDAYVKGRTTTDVNGRWNNDLYLDAGYTYTVLFYKSGAYGPDTKEVTLP
ncbi:MAG: hypothetical protein HZB62_10765 [Nitrospirae bacterium]|nr:hypothetical protein [Nitrospirota bacterium]